MTDKRRRVHVKLSKIHSYVSGLDFPSEIFGIVYDAPLPVEIEYPSTVYAFEADERGGSMFNLFPFIALRNSFDIFSGQQYYGEAMLLNLYVVEGNLSLSAAVRCRLDPADTAEDR